MKIENKEVYFCDHCKKHLFRKSAMIRHEKLCLNNPENHKKCLSGCKYLEIITHKVVFINGCDHGQETYEEKEVQVFLCTKFDKLMFPFSIERKKLDKRYPDTYEDQEPMPKECEGFEHEYASIDNFNLNW
jgi:hypothetical protein